MAEDTSFLDLTKTYKDRITKMLAQSAEGPSLNDIGTALISANATGRPYTQALAAQEQVKQQRAQGFLDLIKRVRDEEVENERLALSRETLDVNRGKLALDLLQEKNKEGNKNAAAIMKAVETFVPNPEERSIVAAHLESIPTKIGEGNALSVVPQEVQRLVAAGKITGKNKPERPLVSIDNKAETAGAVESAKQLSKLGTDYYEAASQAQKDVRNLEVARGILERGVETGMGTETKMAIANFAKSNLGLNLDSKLGDKEMLAAIANRMGIDVAPKGQGQVSNYERELFQKAVAVAMGRSTEGNKKLVNWYLKLRRQDADVAKLYVDELRGGKGVTPEFLEKVRQHYEKPVFSKEDLAELERLGAGPATPAPAIDPNAALEELRRRGVVQ